MNPSPDRCPACATRWTDHLGLIGTCAKLRIAQANLDRIHNLIVESNYYGSLAAPRGAAKVLHQILEITEEKP